MLPTVQGINPSPPFDLSRSTLSLGLGPSTEMTRTKAPLVISEVTNMPGLSSLGLMGP